MGCKDSSKFKQINGRNIFVKKVNKFWLEKNLIVVLPCF